MLHICRCTPNLNLSQRIKAQRIKSRDMFRGLQNKRVIAETKLSEDLVSFQSELKQIVKEDMEYMKVGLSGFGTTNSHVVEPEVVDPDF